MKKLKYITIALLIAAAMSSCWIIPSPYKECWDEFRGTQWRLAYIAPNAIHLLEHPLIVERTILEPHDCDTCFTLTFDAKKTGYITGVSILNTVDVQILRGPELPDIKVSVTELDEPFDGNLYSNLMRSVTGIAQGAGDVHLFSGSSTHPAHYILTFKQITH